MVLASQPEKPDCVRPQAMAVAVPMISRMAPDSPAVLTSMRPRLRHFIWR